MSVPSKHLRFQSSAIVRGLAFNQIKTGTVPSITVRRGGRNSLQIKLRPDRPVDDPFGHRGGLKCTVRRSYLVSESSFDFVDQLNSGVFLPYEGMSIKLPHIVAHRGEVIDAEGKLSDGYSLPWKYLPEELKGISKQALEELTNETQQFIKQLVWFFNITHAHNCVDHVDLYWTAKGKYYHYVKFPQRAGGDWHNDVIWNETNEAGYLSIWKAGDEEPLAHELFREAGWLLNSAPRSALLIMFNALETGVKSYVSRCVPETGWLMTETQSPPVAKMLKKYIPTLTPQINVDLSNWSQLNHLFNRLENKLTVWRNHLAHRGHTEFSTDELRELRDDVSDVLYILDYLSGQSWAINNVRKKTCQALGWPDPSPTQRGLRATVSIVDE